MACELEAKPALQNLKGLTLTSKTRCFGLDTGVFIPAAHDKPATADKDAAKGEETATLLNVVVWLHGYEVPNISALFLSNEAKIRDSVSNSGKDAVLVAPFLGFKHDVGPTVVGDDGKKHHTTVWGGSYDTTTLGGAKGGEKYLDAVLAGLADFMGKKAAKDGASGSPIQYQIRNLVLACHSGGGAEMRAMVQTLGKYQTNLKQCWAFDCLYGSGLTPDTATFWHEEVKKGFELYAFFGPSTVFPSVKLFLMSQGMTTTTEEKLDPPRGTNKSVHVTIGYDAAAQTATAGVNLDDLANAGAQREMNNTPPKLLKDKDFLKQTYVWQMASNVARAHVYPPDAHYFIARSFFTSQLKNSGLF